MLEGSSELKGIVQDSKGLTSKSINFNIDSIIKSNNLTNLYINHQIISEQQHLLKNLSN